MPATVCLTVFSTCCFFVACVFYFTAICDIRDMRIGFLLCDSDILNSWFPINGYTIFILSLLYGYTDQFTDWVLGLPNDKSKLQLFATFASDRDDFAQIAFY